jgi:hypothetical protein
MLDRLRRMADALFTTPGAPLISAARDQRPAPSAFVAPRVLLITHNPPVPSEGGRRLHQVFGWNDPEALVGGYIDDLARCSGGYLRYSIVERIAADWFPPKVDGFRYTPESYVSGWRARAMYQPDQIDYQAQLRAFDLIGRFERGEFDEAWFMSFPYSGDYESTMVGRDAFWCNSPPVANTHGCRGRFVVMAFNYERGVDCMLENFGHRFESIMGHVFRQHAPQQNLWELFTRYDRSHPGQAQCGNVHFAPNSERDYDWGNRRSVPSFCDDWYGFPDLAGAARMVDCGEWGGGDMRAHHLWWFEHMPRVAGETFGVSNNWWEYVTLARNPDRPGAPASAWLGHG